MGKDIKVEVIDRPDILIRSEHFYTTLYRGNLADSFQFHSHGGVGLYYMAVQTHDIDELIAFLKHVKKTLTTI